MKKIFLWCTLLLSTQLMATVYSDGSDSNDLTEHVTNTTSVYSNGSNSNEWRVYAGEGTISSAIPVGRDNSAIILNGEGKSTGYRLSRNLWRDTKHNSIRWDMNYSENFTVYILIRTNNGARYMVYTPRDNDRGRSGNYLLFGLGVHADDGGWRTFTRNLENDLHRFEPNNQLVSIEAFLIRGSGQLDNIETIQQGIRVTEVVFEDAQDGETTGWSSYTNPTRTRITNINTSYYNKVIKLSGEGLSDGYRFPMQSSKRFIRWYMKYKEVFTIYLRIQTTEGIRYLVYTPQDDDRGISRNYLRFGLGANADNGRGKTFTRDLVADLHQFEPNNNFIAIHDFLIRGSGLIDDIVMMSWEDYGFDRVKFLNLIDEQREIALNISSVASTTLLTSRIGIVISDMGSKVYTLNSQGELLTLASPPFCSTRFGDGSHLFVDFNIEGDILTMRGLSTLGDINRLDEFNYRIGEYSLTRIP